MQCHSTHHTQAGAVLARSAPIIPVTPTVSSRTLAAAAGIQSVLQTPLSSVLCMPAAHTYINTVPHIQLPANTVNMHTCTSHTSLPAGIATTTATAPLAAVAQQLPHTANVSSVPLTAAAATTTFTSTSATAAVDVLSSHSVTIATCAQPLQPFINTATTTPALVQSTTTFGNTPLLTQSIPVVNTTTCLQPLATTISGTTATTTPATTVPVAPVVVVKQQQLPKPYNGSTSWRSFKDHFERIARVNAWSTHAD